MLYKNYINYDRTQILNMDFLSKIITDNVSPFDAEVNHSGIYSYRPDVQLSQCICIIHYVYTCVIIYVLTGACIY